MAPTALQAQSRPDDSTADPADQVVTYAEHISPIFDRQCVPCHDGGPGSPFGLDSFESVRGKSRLISIVVGQRTMPPSLLEPSVGDFSNSGLLSEVEIELIQQWASTGAQEGSVVPSAHRPRDLADRPIREPNLILQPTQELLLAPDAFARSHTFRLIMPPEGTHSVTGVALRGAIEGIINAQLTILPEGTAFDPEDPARMRIDTAISFAPSPAYGGLMVEKTPSTWPPSAGIDLPRGATAWLHVHLQGIGSETRVRPEVALYFADPPSADLKHSTTEILTLSFGADSLDLPAGDGKRSIRRRLTLPVAVVLVGILPQAHLVATRLQAHAILPDGDTIDLLSIPDWQVSLQRQYWLRQPLKLPAGTSVEMDFEYDNSDQNFDNPNYPAKDIHWGPSLMDEVAGLNLQVIVDPEVDREMLRAALEKARRPSATTAGPDQN